MTIAITKEVVPGVKFTVLSDGYDGSGPSIVVPIEYLPQFTHDELHGVISELVPLAKLASTLNFAEYLVSKCEGDRVPSWLIEEESERVAELLSQEGYGGNIDKAIALIRKTKQRTSYRIASKAKRSEITSRYNDIFMAIGRRDGFCCVHCSSSQDLSIDHIVAVINGGGNELDNLQLLCKSCNSKKSDK